MTKEGHYMPWYIGGTMLMIVGTALMSRINENTSTSAIYGFSVITAMGAGSIFQASFSVAQALVPEAEVQLGLSPPPLKHSLSYPPSTQLPNPLNHPSSASNSHSFHKHRPNRRNNSCPRPCKFCLPRTRHPKDFCHPSPGNALINRTNDNHRHWLSTYSVFD